MAKKKVLITGHAGLIGTVLRESYLADKYELSFLDRQKATGVESFVVDISNDNILPAFEGKDVVIHLAADKHEDAPFESVLKNNIIGTYKVFEAARNAEVERVIFASSVRATDMYQLGKIPKGTEGNWAILWGNFGTKPDKIISVNDALRPYGPYGVSKLFGENLGRYYSDRYGLSVICFRLGGLLQENRTTDEFTKRVWLSWRDAIDGFDRAIKAEGVDFGVFYLTSNNKRNAYDISSTMKILGYNPQDDSENIT